MRRTLFFLFVFMALHSYSYGSEFLTKEKHVTIDNDWKIRAEYKHVVYLDNEDDLPLFSEINMPVTTPDRKVSDVYAYLTANGERHTGADMDGKISFPDLNAGATLEYGYTVETAFYGFEGIFSDRFNAGDILEVKQSRYSLTFPDKTKLRWALDGDKNKINESMNDHFMWEFKDIDENSKEGSLMLTTLSSWDEVNDRYSVLYGGISDKSFDIDLTKIGLKEDSSDDEKINKVMGYLKSNFSYRAYTSSGHNLIPDPPKEVIDRGWGDCKDLVLLGVTILNRLGFDAFTVLVGPSEAIVNTQLPTPYILDHAVLGVRFEDGIRYYDYLVPGYYADTEGNILITVLN